MNDASQVYDAAVIGGGPAGLTAAIARLDARSQDILRRRWINEEKPTLHELAAEYGVSAERIRQIEAAAMKRVKALMVA